MKRLVLALALACAAIAAFTAVALGDTVYGVAEDASKYADDGGASVYADLKALGMAENRWTLLYDPAAPGKELPFLDRAVPVAARYGISIVLSVYPVPGQGLPLQPGFADQFCTWVGKVAARYPSIRQFIVGNEVNASRFWPQGDAGIKSFYDTLAACYDQLKAVSPSITVIGMGLAPRAVSESSTKPLAFIRRVGDFYRASGRTAPIMDMLAIHPYPNPNANPPPAPKDASYQDPDFFGMPQLDRVKAALETAFGGTGQPTTKNGLRLKIDELGYQTDTSGKPQYTGTETSPIVTEQTQSDDYRQAIAMLSCDPAVQSILLFHLIDESQRNPDASSGGWQSGLEYPDRGHKPSFDGVASAIAGGCDSSAATGGGTTGSGGAGGGTPGGSGTPSPTPPPAGSSLLVNSFFESVGTSNEFTPAPATDGWFIFDTDLVNRLDGMHVGDPRLTLSVDAAFSILVVANGGDPRSYGPQYYRGLAAHAKNPPKVLRAKVLRRIRGRLAKGSPLQFVVPVAKLAPGSYRLAIRLAPVGGGKPVGLLTRPFTIAAKPR